MSVFYTAFKKGVAVLVFLVSTPAISLDLNFITLEVAPWAYHDKVSNKLKGIFPDLVREIDSRTLHTINMTLTPYVRIDRELESGRQDCTMLIRGVERDKFVILGELILDHPMGVIPRKDISLVKYEDLTKVTVSVLRDLNITDKFDLDKKIKKQYDTDYEMGLRKMNHKRLDAIAGAIPTIQYLAKTNGMENMLGEPLELSSEPVFFQCSRNSQKNHVINEFNSIIRQIKSDGVLDEILKKNE